MIAKPKHRTCGRGRGGYSPALARRGGFVLLAGVHERLDLRGLPPAFPSLGALTLPTRLAAAIFAFAKVG